MVLATGAWGQDSVSFTGKDMRQLVASMAGATGLFATPQEGITSGFKVTAQGSPNNTVSVAAGTAVVTADGAGLFGAYNAWNDAALTSPTFTATGGSARKDRLILRINSGVPALEVVAGTAGSGVPPTVTGNNWIPLAQIALPASTTNITAGFIIDERVFIGRWMEPWGLIDYVPLTTTTGNFSGGVLCTSAKTYAANRRIRLTGLAVVQAVSGGQIVNASIEELSLGNLCNSGFTVSPASFFVTCNPGVVITPTAGPHTYRLIFTTNTGLMNASCSATQPSWLCIEDIGPATPAPD